MSDSNRGTDCIMEDLGTWYLTSLEFPRRHLELIHGGLRNFGFDQPRIPRSPKELELLMEGLEILDLNSPEYTSTDLDHITVNLGTDQSECSFPLPTIYFAVTLIILLYTYRHAH